MSIKEAITDIVIRNAVKYARKDFDRNAPRILSLVEKADVKKVNRSTYAGLHKVMDDPNNNWMRFAKDLICNTDEHVINKLIPPLMNVAINSYTKRMAAIEKYGCNVLGQFLWTRQQPATLNARDAGLPNTVTQARFHMRICQELSARVKSSAHICISTPAVNRQ